MHPEEKDMLRTEKEKNENRHNTKTQWKTILKS